MAAPRLLIGCSGWVYKDWRGRFYPDGLAARKWLPHYASHFPTVEINGSFYRLPAPETFASWREAVPPGFVFAVKASRYLTHLKHLADPEAPLERLFTSVAALGPRLGPVLYQLPPRWVPSPERFAHFLAALPKKVGTRRVEHVVEFRDPRGYSEEMLALLRAHGVGLCLHDMPGSAPPREITARFTYVRFHGVDGKYNGSYPDERLARWADWLRAQSAAGLRAYAYFNNDIGGAAIENARTLTRLVEGGTRDAESA
jgi:uncharacterized protein YecE (DUF72 family)